jgi:diguanylate cyclase (GGDEF)-like protein
MDNKILVVDDSHVTLTTIVGQLKKHGFLVEQANDGIKALEKTEEFHPDIVLLDVMMPNMDGFTVCEKIKQQAAMQNFTPVILVTAYGDIKSKVKGFETGADDYLTKPFDMQELLARVRSMLRIKGLYDQLKFAKEKLETLSITDGLTGIFNHRYLHEKLSVEFERIRRYDGFLSCIMLDLDHFKNVNDTYGHKFGDFVLINFAKIIKNTIREVDFVARYGGEEFTIVLPQTTIDNAEILAEKIRKKVEAYKFEKNGTSIHVTSSLGISTYPHPKIKTVEDLIRTADESLYRAKHKGRNTIVKME